MEDLQKQVQRLEAENATLRSLLSEAVSLIDIDPRAGAKTSLLRAVVPFVASPGLREHPLTKHIEAALRR